jgi:hypothetical protein
MSFSSAAKPQNMSAGAYFGERIGRGWIYWMADPKSMDSTVYSRPLRQTARDWLAAFLWEQFIARAGLSRSDQAMGKPGAAHYCAHRECPGAGARYGDESGCPQQYQPAHGDYGSEDQRLAPPRLGQRHTAYEREYE